MMLKLSGARGVVMAIALALGSFGGMAAAHADYYHNGHHYKHHRFVRDHKHPNGHYEYY
jgi:hypothetical protein